MSDQYDLMYLENPIDNIELFRVTYDGQFLIKGKAITNQDVLEVLRSLFTKFEFSCKKEESNG